MTGIDYGRFDALTFDCYGTLIDWEAGILAGLRTVLAPRGIEASDDQLLEAYATLEARAEAGPYLRYRDILAFALLGVTAKFGVVPKPAEVDAFSESVALWPAFPDSTEALGRLKSRFRLGVITNCDDDLFARSATCLQVDFDWVVTAEQVGAYKPSERNFEVAFERLGLPRDRILHVAQSLFHDHVTAKRLGLTTVWIDRRQGRSGSGATPQAQVTTPDATFPDMASFAAAATAGAG